LSLEVKSPCCKVLVTPVLTPTVSEAVDTYSYRHETRPAAEPEALPLAGGVPCYGLTSTFGRGDLLPGACQAVYILHIVTIYMRIATYLMTSQGWTLPTYAVGRYASK
jgi:hypothetical protein